MTRKRKDGKVSVVHLANYVAPVIKTETTEDYITYGPKNSYFKYLIDRYTGSPTNNAIINSISQMIFGKGLDASDSSKDPENYARMKVLLKDEIVRKLAFDLKLFGQFAIQIIYSKDRKTIAQIEHIPVETLAMGKMDENGNINDYWYCSDWEKKHKLGVTRFPAFGTSREAIEIMYVKPYVSGHYYYSPPDYNGGLQYAELEEEIANFHLSNVQNGMAPSMMVNFNNGVPDEETQKDIEGKITKKFSGSSNAGRFILSFNDSKESAADITPVQLSDAHNQYQFLSSETMYKLMVSHRVVSPMLLGIKDSTGLGNNADEIKTASILMDNIVIRPFQEILIDAFNEILSFNGITFNLYFKTIQPLEFTDLTNAKTSETVEQETGVKMSEVQNDFTDEEGFRMIDLLQSGTLGDEWEEVAEREHTDDLPDEEWAARLLRERKSLFAQIITAKPSEFSYLDKSLYKIRYRYAQKYSSDNSREFCKQMMSKSRGGEVYRLEDIDRASREGVNQSLGHKGQPYDLFKYKGGVNCGHVWNQVLYRLKNKTVKSENIKDYDETNSIPKTYIISPRGTKEAVKAPKDMPNNGHHPNYGK